MILVAGSRVGPYEILGPLGAGGIPYFQGRAGRREEAIRSLEKLKPLSKDRYVSSSRFNWRTWGSTRRTRPSWQEKAYEERSVLRFLELDPIFDPIRDDPRFVKLLHRMGLPA